MKDFTITLVVLAVLSLKTDGCISMSQEERVSDRTNADVQKKQNAVVTELQRNHVHDGDNLGEHDNSLVKAYLRSFGYAKPGDSLEKTLKDFQRFLGMNPSGKLDVPTRSAIMRKRCGNRDLDDEPTKVWEKTTINYGIASFPKQLKPSQVRELIKQAFAAWEIVIAVEFVEVRNALHADVIIRFDARNTVNGTDRSGFSVAAASAPLNSTIWLKADENWAVFHRQEPNRTDLFLTIVHEIGHVLGLNHSSDPDSVMFPIFQRQVGQELPVINADDVERLRNIYDPHSSALNQGGETLNAASHEDDVEPGCPSALWTATRAPSGRIFVFADASAWVFDASRRLVSGPHRIGTLFPGAPARIDVAVSGGQRVALIDDRDVYQYTEEAEGGAFRAVPGSPFPLHSRVLFFPSAAFPLYNTSVILLDGNVFATYDLELNQPVMLGDKTVAFPDLPPDLRAGLLDSAKAGTPVYDMFSTDTVVKYDLIKPQTTKSVPLSEFLICSQS